MMILLPANTKRFQYLVRQRPDEWGWLMSPRRNLSSPMMDIPNARWAADNDAYNGFDPSAFLAMLDCNAKYRRSCLFVVCPDSVGSHAETEDLWYRWKAEIKGRGYPAAFVAQDGATVDNLPWQTLDALFIGGTDEFKDRLAAPIIREARRVGVWVHVGRVNDSETRLAYCLNLNVSSIDGTAYGYKPQKMIRWYYNQRRQRAMQRSLPL
jgi:hypothetical protein